MTRIDYSDVFDDDGIPESIGMVAMRCDGCGNIHVAMLDADSEPLCAMTLDDADTIKMALQLLHAALPEIDTQTLVDRINTVTGKTDARKH